MKIKQLFLFLFKILNIFAVENKIEFVVVVASYNNEKYVFRNLDSIIHQKVDVPFEVIYCNDCSTDKTGKYVDKFIKYNKCESLFKVIHNTKRVGILENHYNIINKIDDHKIIVLLDGDDFWSNDRVLARIKKEYEDPNTWLTYGQFMIYPEGDIGWCCPFPENVLKYNTFRNYKWISTHQKTFKAGLFKKIKKQDFLYNGKYYQMAGDLAIMFPMLEMASKGHIRFIPDILYLYNHHNPLSDITTNRGLQMSLSFHILKKPRYTPLDSL